MTSTGLVATRKMPEKPERTTGSTMERKTSALRASSAGRSSPGFCATPAHSTTMSASAQSAYWPVAMRMCPGEKARPWLRSIASPSARAASMSMSSSSSQAL